MVRLDPVHFVLSALESTPGRLLAALPAFVCGHDLCTGLCYIVLPTGLYLRPYRVYGNDIFAQAVRLLYATDTPTSVCPSIHVFNSVTLMLAYYRSRIFDAPQRRWMRPAAAVLCVSIVLATVLLKQHSCIDVMMGILLALVLDSAMTLRDNDTSRVPERL